LSSKESSRKGRPVDVAKREAIIAAAASQFFDRGFAAASIEQIAADAGVSKVTVYSHFGDKRGLFMAAVDAECGRLREHFALDELPRGTLRKRLTKIGEEMVAFLSRPEVVQFDRRIAAETEHEPDAGAAFLAAGPHRLREAFAALLAAMHQVGEIDVEDPYLAAEQFVSMCKGMGDLERRFGHPANPEQDRRRIAAAVEIFCRAYARDCD
jgi:TetR/AcrR family transcriptional regulator, mexJK operon transcriptional repressor